MHCRLLLWLKSVHGSPVCRVTSSPGHTGSPACLHLLLVAAYQKIFFPAAAAVLSVSSFSCLFFSVTFCSFQLCICPCGVLSYAHTSGNSHCALFYYSPLPFMYHHPDGVSLLSGLHQAAAIFFAVIFQPFLLSGGDTACML